MPLFVISLYITSRQIRHLRKICDWPNRQLSTWPFLSSHLNIWPNPWWIFGTPAIFVEICLKSIFPSLSRTLFGILPDRWWILAQFPTFSNFPFLWKLPTVNMPLLLSYCLNPCQIRRFRKTHNNGHASFAILF